MTGLEQRDQDTASGAETLEPFDERWARWQAKGLARDVRTRARLNGLRILVAVAVVAVVAWTVLRGVSAS